MWEAGDDGQREAEVSGRGNAWTEGGDDYKFADYLTNWSKWGATFAGILANGPQSITMWNLALDERGRPNIGPFDCGGLVQIHSQTKEITQTACIGAGPPCPGVRRWRGDCRFARCERRRSRGECRTDRTASVSSTVTATPNNASLPRVFHTCR